MNELKLDNIEKDSIFNEKFGEISNSLYLDFKMLKKYCPQRIIIYTLYRKKSSYMHILNTTNSVYQ